MRCFWSKWLSFGGFTLMAVQRTDDSIPYISDHSMLMLWSWPLLDCTSRSYHSIPPILQYWRRRAPILFPLPNDWNDWIEGKIAETQVQEKQDNLGGNIRHLEDFVEVVIYDLPLFYSLELPSYSACTHKQSTHCIKARMFSEKRHFHREPIEPSLLSGYLPVSSWYCAFS